MAFQPMGMVIGLMFARQQNVADASARNRLMLLGGLFGANPTGLIISHELARREGALEAAASPGTGTGGGVPNVQIPDVSGGSYDDAVAALQGLQLAAQRQDVVSSTVDKDQVIDTDPPASTLVASGSTVTVRVSLGVQISSVVGMKTADARKKLEGIGFKVTTKPKDPAPDSNVSAQSPDGGSYDNAGANVTLTCVTP